MRKALGILRDGIALLAIFALFAALASCSSDNDRPTPSIFPLTVYWTAPDALDNDEPLAIEEIEGYQLACFDAEGYPISTLPLTPYVQRARIWVRPGTYSCEVKAQARGLWSDPSNTVTKVIQ